MLNSPKTKLKKKSKKDFPEYPRHTSGDDIYKQDKEETVIDPEVTPKPKRPMKK